LFVHRADAIPVAVECDPELRALADAAKLREVAA